MQKYIKRVLGQGEHILYTARIHWFVYVQGLLILLLTPFLSMIAMDLGTELFGRGMQDWGPDVIDVMSLALISYAALLLLVGYIRQISTELVITNRRVIAKYGFVSTTTYELMLSKVEGANIDQTVVGRLFGFGTVLVKGTGGGISPIDLVAMPFIFHRKLMRVVEAYHRQQSGYRNRDDSSDD